MPRTGHQKAAHNNSVIHDTAAMIEAEIKAARDAGAEGFLIWNARNVYEPAKYGKQ